MILKFVYTLFTAVLFAALVGFGIAAFYTAPKEPDYPTELKIAGPEQRVSNELYSELKNKQELYDKDLKVFMAKMETYNRNVALVAIGASIITLFVSLSLFKKILLIADGLLLGGVFTLIYSIIRGIASGNDKFRFMIVAAGFIMALILGYIKLIKTEKKEVAKNGKNQKRRI